MNRFDAEPSPKPAGACVFKVADRTYPFLPPGDPRWGPFRRKVRDQINPYLIAKDKACSAPGLSADDRRLIESIGFEKLVEQDEAEASEALGIHMKGVLNHAEFWVEGLSIANPEHTRDEWENFILDLPISAARSVRIEFVDPS